MGKPIRTLRRKFVQLAGYIGRYIGEYYMIAPLAVSALIDEAIAANLPRMPPSRVTSAACTFM